MVTRFIALLPAVLLAACASLQVGGDFQSGRQALLRDQSEQALPYFLAAAKTNPDYVYESMYFREGIWTYVGRTQYAIKRFGEARQSLVQALEKDPNDNLARLYLGLTLMRSGEYERGLRELQNAMAGLHDWLEYIQRTRPYESYWDPTREIRGAIEKDLEKIKAKDIDREELIADGEWLGKQMEEEMDRAERDERLRYEREGDHNRHGHGGVSGGVSIGF
ncbi:MAG: tetratricopeptide repeat protein [Chloroflexota bacterium]